MAVATPVLEKKIEETQEEARYNTTQLEDEIHNSRISEIYAKLIKPETKLSDLRPAAPVHQASEQYTQEDEPVQQVYEAVAPAQPETRFVEGARTDAEIFRADSAINRKVTFVQAETVAVAQQVVSEEENEDLKPTRTTMQYTVENKEADADGTIVNASAQNRISLTKRDKVVIAVVISIIVALFALIIINSVIISGLNSDLSSLQASLNSARGTYERVTSEIADYESNFDETLKALAESLGMVR